MTGVKNIIFDYGGVILNIDYRKTVEAFMNLGLADFGKLYSQALQVDMFDQLEKGLLSADQFYRKIRELSGMELADEDLASAWNAIIGEMPSCRIDLLKKVRLKYRIFLLSNTNEIHYALYLKQLQEKYGFANFDDLFEKAYFSFQVGMKKPDREIFELVLSENGLDPGATLFIDDSIQQIEGARQCGLLAYHLSDGRDVITLFDVGTGELIL